MASEELHSQPLPDDPPPFLGEWPRVYVGVLAYLLVLIVALYVFSQAFSY